MSDGGCSAPTEGSDDWDAHWSGFSASATTNPAQRYRHRLLLCMIGHRHPRQVLDIGCGQGDLLAKVSQRFPGIKLAGLELSAVGVQHTRDKVRTADVRQIDLLSEDASINIAGIRADVAVCCEVLEHLDEPERFLGVAKAALAPGATLFVTVPRGPLSAFDRLIGHRRHYTTGELRELLTNAGFEVERIDRAGFPFFNLYRLVVIARGDRLATDVGAAGTTAAAAAVMAMFRLLFRFNLPRSPWGWQNVARARIPSGDGAR